MDCPACGFDPEFEEVYKAKSELKRAFRDAKKLDEARKTVREFLSRQSRHHIDIYGGAYALLQEVLED
jgi:hypothetical protein